MGQSAAILIGNTTYDKLEALDCCANDVTQMCELLSETQKYNQIIKFVDQPVAIVKDELRLLADTNEEFDEIFLYFTGHGFSNSDDFFMCFNEFNENSPNTTAIARTEALDLFRRFKAEISVLVVDACEAGRNLIKSDVVPITKLAKLGLTNFVQFSSCTESQYSLAGAK